MLKSKGALSTAGIWNKVFFLFIFAMPFSALSVYTTGVLPLDKALAPLLLLVGVFRLLNQRGKRFRLVLFYVGLATLFLIASNLSLITDLEVFLPAFGEMAVNLGYFLLPVLFIRDIHYFRTTAAWIVIVTMLACLSAFLVATGVLVLPYERFEESRLGLTFLPKSTGLLSNYGDMTLLCVFTVLFTMKISGRDYFFGYGSRWLKTLVLLVVMAGLIGAQSRNLLLSVVFALLVSYGLTKLKVNRAGNRSAKALMFGYIGLFLLIVLTVFASDVYQSIAGLGGENAQFNAEGRLAQYQLAWEIFLDSPLFGIDPSGYRQISGVDNIHSLWFGLAARGGFVSVFLIIFWFFLAIRRSLRVLADQDRFNEAVVIVAFLLSMLLTVSFYPAHRVTMFWFLFGVAASLMCLAPPLRRRHAEEALLSPIQKVA